MSELAWRFCSVLALGGWWSGMALCTCLGPHLEPPSSPSLALLTLMEVFWGVETRP